MKLRELGRRRCASDPIATLEALAATVRHFQEARDAVLRVRRPAAKAAHEAVGKVIDSIGDGLGDLLQTVVEPVWSDLPESIRAKCRTAGVEGPPRC